MKRPKKTMMKPRNPFAVPAKFRTAAGPMKGRKNGFNKEARKAGRKLIEEEKRDL